MCRCARPGPERCLNWRSLRSAMGDEAFRASHYLDARSLFERVALEQPFFEFLTLPAYTTLS